MANNYEVLDSTETAVVFKSTDTAGVHVTHHNVDLSVLPTGASTATNQDTEITHLSQIETLLAAPITVRSYSPVFDVTLSTDTSAYASGDVIADSQVLTNIMRANDSTGILQSVTMLDKADQKVAMTLYFLSANVAMGTENAAPSISDANSLNILGSVDIAASDWKDLGGTAVASIKGIGLGLAPASGTRNVYIAVVNGTGTPTFAADSLVARLTVLQD